MPLHRGIPGSWLKVGGKLFGPLAFGTKGTNEAQFLRQIIVDTDPMFLKWAIRAIIRWQGGHDLPMLRHLHGDRDRLFPLKAMEDANVLSGGTHWMIYQRGEEVIRWIAQEW
ncbi:MAG: hypothetical protein AAF399_15355 [Bacteroidota bacterium]